MFHIISQNIFNVNTEYMKFYMYGRKNNKHSSDIVLSVRLTKPAVCDINSINHIHGKKLKKRSCGLYTEYKAHKNSF